MSRNFGRNGSNHGGGNKKVPDRWLNYKGIGNQIEGTPFVAFKVPLHKTICEKLPDCERHTTREIMEALPELGMVIDLTNTPNRTKYYQPEDWKSNGIAYQWIKCEGHVTPKQELLVHFCRTVRKFMINNPRRLIGIHCTHGLNRTGYFVCSFMVLVLRIPPQDALKMFATARGYEIERANYINSIISHHTNFDLRRLTLMQSVQIQLLNNGEHSRRIQNQDTPFPYPPPEFLTRQFGNRYANPPPPYHNNRHHSRLPPSNANFRDRSANYRDRGANPTPNLYRLDNRPRFNPSQQRRSGNSI